jgi:hypothetical protein
MELPYFPNPGNEKSRRDGWSGPDPEKVTFIRARLDGVGEPKTFKGRFAWTLAQLISAGSGGVTSFERPAPRWSHYVMMLRRNGVAIQTKEERHGGEFKGRHGRYVLSSPVEVLETRAVA